MSPSKTNGEDHRGKKLQAVDEDYRVSYRVCSSLILNFSLCGSLTVAGDAKNHNLGGSHSK